MGLACTSSDLTRTGDSSLIWLLKKQKTKTKTHGPRRTEPSEVSRSSIPKDDRCSSSPPQRWLGCESTRMSGSPCQDNGRGWPDFSATPFLFGHRRGRKGLVLYVYAERRQIPLSFESSAELHPKLDSNLTRGRHRIVLSVTYAVGYRMCRLQ